MVIHLLEHKTCDDKYLWQVSNYRRSVQPFISNLSTPTRTSKPNLEYEIFIIYVGTTLTFSQSLFE